jgi:hypothetical protein
MFTGPGLLGGDIDGIVPQHTPSPHMPQFTSPATAPELMMATAPVSRRAQMWRGVLDVVSARRAGSLLRHCLLAWLTGLLPSIGFLALAHGVLALLGIDSAPFQRDDVVPTFKAAFYAVAIAPLVETLLLGALLWLLSLLSPRPLFVAAVSGVLWGCVHGRLGLLAFFGTFWSFYVFSCSYLAWRPLGWWKAVVVAVLPHALDNLILMLLLLADWS